MRTALAPAALLPLLLAGPLPAQDRAAAAAASRFDPIAFFTGRTQGTGRLRPILSPGRAIDVQGEGRVDRDGTLILRQTVEERGKDPRRREWRIREVAPGRYAGTLSDAAGPVAGELVEGRLRLRYRMKGGLNVVQRIEAAPDGRSARNRMTISRLGVPVARLDETIRRIGL
jgi:hypothetical protein